MRPLWADYYEAGVRIQTISDPMGIGKNAIEVAATRSGLTRPIRASVCPICLRSSPETPEDSISGWFLLVRDGVKMCYNCAGKIDNKTLVFSEGEGYRGLLTQETYERIDR
jgi:hypothetical protein